MLTLKPATGLSLVPRDDTKSDLRVNGTTMGLPVDGIILESAWQAGDAYLIAATMDVMHEDSLHFTLIDPGTGTREALALEWAYSTGQFKVLNLIGDTLTFQFFGDTDWRLQVLADPVFRLPFLSDPRGVSRKLGFSSRLKISGNPKPETS